MRWRDGGAVAMRTARQGKPARLGPAELAKVKRVLDRGAVQAEFYNDLWTLARVAEVIERVTGCRGYQPNPTPLSKASYGPAWWRTEE